MGTITTPQWCPVHVLQLTLLKWGVLLCLPQLSLPLSATSIPIDSAQACTFPNLSQSLTIHPGSHKLCSTTTLIYDLASGQQAATLVSGKWLFDPLTYDPRKYFPDAFFSTLVATALVSRQRR